MSYNNGPYIFVKSGDSIIYRMSRITWSNFAYFKMIVQDHLNKENPSNIIELEFIDDVGDFWKFLKNNFPKENVDFSLNVKTICITFGILDNNIFMGRLKQLLLDSAIKYFHKREINLLLYPLDYNYNSHIENMNIRRKTQQSIIEKFLEISLDDPRCDDELFFSR